MIMPGNNNVGGENNAVRFIKIKYNVYKIDIKLKCTIFGWFWVLNRLLVNVLF